MVYFILLIIFLFGLILFIYDFFFVRAEKYKLEKKNDTDNFCVLIPARNESRVIENLLLSIKNQSVKVNMENVYVIVEDEKDKSIEIAKKLGTSYFVRKKLELKSKGYALMEIIDYLQANNLKYDLYFIMDADNILDVDFIKNMLDSYKDGYDIVTGYRKSTNTNKNRITISSSLTFLLINTLLNESKLAKNRPITLSGTGYFITRELIDEWNTFPFHLLTEDYELSVYGALKNYKTYYNKDAIFYDEQPLTFKESMKQRTRWVKGYFQVRKKYHNALLKNLKSKIVIGEYIGLNPYLTMLIAVILFYLYQIILMIYNLINKSSILLNIYLIIGITLIGYMFLEILTVVMLKKDNDNLELTINSKIKAILYNPIFLISYVICMVRCIGRNVTWEKIEHKGNK